IGSGGTLILDGSTVSGNSATNKGGGICVLSAASNVTIRNSTISGNLAATGGGISLLNFSGTVLVENSTITGNTAVSYSSAPGYGGGGIGVTGLATDGLILHSSIVAGNVQTASAANRPDLSLFGGAVTADHSLIGVAD